MKTLFLTGGRGNIGEAIKAKFEQMGYIVIAPASSELDLSDLACIKKYLNNVNDIDAIIHCAGFNSPKLMNDLSYEDIQKTSDINFISFFEIVKLLSPHMKEKKQGHILGISSLYGTITRKGRLAYTASKHALNGIVKTMACELGTYNILVNSLSPGFVDTKMTRKNNTEEQIKNMESKIPLGRLANVKDIANAAYFLCSEDNTYITGQNIIVDGGFMAEGGQGNV